MGVEIGSINVQIHAVCSFLVRSGANKWSTNSTQWWRHPNDTHTAVWAFFVVVKSSLLVLPSCRFLHPHSPLLFLLLFAKKPLIIGVTRSWSLLLWGLRNMSAWLHTSECNHQHERLSISKLLHNFHTRDQKKKLLVRILRTLRSYFYVLSKKQVIWSVSLQLYLKYSWNFLQPKLDKFCINFGINFQFSASKWG